MSKLNVDFFKIVREFEAAMNKKMLLKTVFYKRVFGGKGLEFDSFRNYNEEDDAGLIDWKASAKADKPLVRNYIEERDVKIFILIDVGDNMVFGSGNKLKAERVAEIAACLGHLVLFSGDKVGYALYSNNIQVMQNFGGGEKQFYKLIKDLGNTKNYGNYSSLKKALNFVSPRLKKVNAVIILSDFLNIDNETLSSLNKFSSKHETLSMMIRDPVDDQLPDLQNEIAIEDIKTGEQLIIKPDILQGAYADISRKDKDFIKEFFKKNRIALFENSTNENFILSLTSFLKSRKNRSRR